MSSATIESKSSKEDKITIYFNKVTIKSSLDTTDAFTIPTQTL